VEERIPAELFWSHLIPLAADITSVRELAQTTLTKTVGRQEAAARVHRVRDRLAELKDAFDAELARLGEDWTTSIEPLRQRWNYHGQGLLGQIEERIEPGILVEAATVVLVYPALRGGGAAHLPYNLLHIEVLAADPVAELPELVRLAWLLSLLNQDLPRFSEGVRPSRLATVAGLAMIPITLTVADALQLARCDTEMISLAVKTWLAARDQGEAWTGIVCQWWETYCTLRPAWATALQALDRLLDAT
jgi:hypothetical protein